MNQAEFLQQAHPMLKAVDDAMMRMFNRQPSPEELRADLERKEDEFLAKKQQEHDERI